MPWAGSITSRLPGIPHEVPAMNSAAYQLASRTDRLRAHLWDGLYVAWPALLGLAVGIPALTMAPRPNQDIGLFMLPYLIGILVSLGLGLKNLIRFCRTGQTYGKHKLGLVVVSQSGSSMTALPLFWRTISPAVLGMVPFVGIIASFDCFFIFGESRRCLHDYMAGSMVIDSNCLARAHDGVGLNPTSQDIGFRRF